MTNTRLPSVIGEEAPAPGNFTFQTMFFWSDHSLGNSFSSLIPRPSGPRNCRQSARAAKRWADADALRAQIRALGYEIEDSASGAQVRPVKQSG